MNGFFIKYIYLFYIIVFVLTALYLNRVYHFTNDYQNTASYISNVAGLLGLAITLTEIFFLRNISAEIKASIDNLQSYSDISNISIFLSQTKDDLTSRKYGRAILKLEKVRDVYHENLPSEELENPISAHRKNYDTLNSIIASLTMAENSSTNIPKQEIQSYVSFITSFNEALTKLKIKYKNSIL